MEEPNGSSRPVQNGTAVVDDPAYSRKGVPTTRIQPGIATVHLVNPSHLSFGVGVITPRWLFVLAGATPETYGVPRITDETLEPLDLETVKPGDVVGIGIHTGNALRGYEMGTSRGRAAPWSCSAASTRRSTRRKRRHSAARMRSSRAMAIVSGHRARGRDAGTLQPIYEAGRVDADGFVPARWDLLPEGRYMWALGADGSRLPEALLVLLGLAHRRPEAATAASWTR